jgi:uncharacterized protein with HEPN domain
LPREFSPKRSRYEPPDAELIRDALNHIAALKRHLERDDLSDETVADAVSLRLSAAIESLAQTTTAFRETTFGAEWKDMWATRNRIAHGYTYISLTLITGTVERDLPAVEAKLRAALEGDSGMTEVWAREIADTRAAEPAADPWETRQ